MEEARSRGAKTSALRYYLLLAVSWNLGALAFFKYYNFLGTTLNDMGDILGIGISIPDLSILLPVGISFYTFQISAYTVDVYRNKIQAEKSFSDLLLFLVYFPQLVAGPIERAERLLPMLKNLRPANSGMLISGMYLALWGVFKKVFISDNLIPIVDLTLASRAEVPFPGYFFISIVFAIQVYADFSGYTDIARGISRMMGVELSMNFHLPFLSSNPAEFWRRWHITLGSFWRDYVYIPLGGSRVSAFFQARNVIAIFVIGGLWHGASWGFVIWGFYCGILVWLYLVTEPLIRRIEGAIPGGASVFLYLGRAYTFLTFSSGLLLFRAPTLPDLAHIWNHFLPDPREAGAISTDILWRILFFSTPLLLMQFFQNRQKKMELFLELNRTLRYTLLAVGGVLFILLGAFRTEQFFYFQF